MHYKYITITVLSLITVIYVGIKISSKQVKDDSGVNHNELIVVNSKVANSQSIKLFFNQFENEIESSEILIVYFLAENPCTGCINEFYDYAKLFSQYSDTEKFTTLMLIPNYRKKYHENIASTINATERKQFYDEAPKLINSENGIYLNQIIALNITNQTLLKKINVLNTSTTQSYKKKLISEIFVD
ncbi:MAG: hypothetical protein ABJR05_13520 [Balneola sp.]